MRRFLTLFGLAVVVGTLAAAAMIDRLGYAPRQIAGYIERRTSGHAHLIERSGATLAGWLRRADRGDALPAPWPEWAALHPELPAAEGRLLVAGSVTEFLGLLAQAEPGDVITLLAGEYRFTPTDTIALTRAGREGLPIVVRAEHPGDVRLMFDLVEGFHVLAPYWQFENLVIRGVCEKDSRCEHAFHVVGMAHHVVIRNNRIEDFNAHIKINGLKGVFPDGGQIVDNVLGNTRPRQTANPVAPVDLVAASGWRIEGNLIADFIKAGGDRVSYGAFAKGAGTGNRFLRNVVLCEQRLRGHAGQRVGLSLGGGGTDSAACRDGGCVVEQEGSLVAGNLVAQCSDEGLYLNRASQSVVRNNTLLDTAGIAVRYPESSADLEGNLVDGPIKLRDGAILRQHDNLSGSALPFLIGWHRRQAYFIDAAQLDLRWRDEAPLRTQAVQGEDLCVAEARMRTQIGATEDFGRCLKP